jgi:hypothetical protein
MFSVDCGAAEKDRNPMAEFPKDQDRIDRRIFLLTKLRDGRVKADRIRTDDDPRLRSKAPFALITVDTNRMADDEANLADAAGQDANRLADGDDGGFLLRPRIAESIGDFRGIFQALRDVTEDAMLEIDRTDRSAAEWRVCANQVKERFS